MKPFQKAVFFSTNMANWVKNERKLKRQQFDNRVFEVF